MRVLVYSHSMTIGGSQLVAISLAAAIRDRGHDVIVFAPPGPLATTVEQSGLPFVTRRGPDHRRRHASVRVSAQLLRLVRREEVDLVHTYVSSPSIETVLGPHLFGGAAMVASEYSPHPSPRPLPSSVPLVVGRAAVRARVQSLWRENVVVVEPPLPIGAADVAPSGFLEAYGLDPTIPSVLLVSRLEPGKLEVIETAIEAVGRLAQARPVRLLIVGDGSARSRVQRSARAINYRTGHCVVVLTGELFDARSAYACADVVVGTATAAEWGMAFGKPTVVLGDRGFCLRVDSSSLSYLRQHGPFGVGDGVSGSRALTRQLRSLLDDPAAARRDGEVARRAVRERTPAKAAEALERVYETALRARVSSARRALEGVGTVTHVGLARARRMLSGENPARRRDDVGDVLVR